MEKKSRPSDFVGMTGETKVRRFMEKYGYLCAINGTSVAYNTSAEDAIAELASTVTATLDDEEGSEVTLDIEWTADADYDATAPADYTFTYTLSAQADETVDFTIPEAKKTGEVTVTVNDYTAEATTVEIVEGPSEVVVPLPDGDSKTATYVANVLDQYENEMTDVSADLSLQETVTGVSIADGVVTVTDEAETGTFTVVASHADVAEDATMEVTLANQTSVEATTAAEVEERAALAYVESINLTADVDSVNIAVDRDGELTLKSEDDFVVDGDLTVDAPNLTFNNEVKVTGDVTVVDVATETFNQNSTVGGNFVVGTNDTPADKVLSVNVSSTVANATFNVPATVTGGNNVENAEINSNDIDFDKNPQKVADSSTYDSYIADFESVTNTVDSEVNATAETTSSKELFFRMYDQFGKDVTSEAGNTEAGEIAENLDGEVRIEGSLVADITSEVTTDNLFKITVNEVYGYGQSLSVTLVNVVTIDDEEITFEETFDYSFDEEVQVNKVELSLVDDNVVAGSSATLSAALTDQFGSPFEFDTGDTTSIRWEVVEGSDVANFGGSEVADVTDAKTVSIDAVSEGTFTVNATYINGSHRVTSENLELTVVAPDLTGINAPTFDQGYNNEEFTSTNTITATPTGATLTPDMINFELTAMPEEATADDISIDAAYNDSDEIVVNVTTDVEGSYTFTPYVGDAVDAEDAIVASDVTVETVLNPNPTSIEQVESQTATIEGIAVEVPIVVKNTHGEVISKTLLDNDNTGINSPNLTVYDSDMNIVADDDFSISTSDLDEGVSFKIVMAPTVGTLEAGDYTVRVGLDDKAFNMEYNLELLPEATITDANLDTIVSENDEWAANDNSAYMPIQFIDQYNDVMEISSLTIGNYIEVVNSAGNSASGFTLGWAEEADPYTSLSSGTIAAVEITNDSASAGTYTLKVVDPNEDSAVIAEKEFEVVEARKPTTMELAQITEAAILAGDTVNITQDDVTVYDQYNVEYPLTWASDTAGAGDPRVVASGDKNLITIDQSNLDGDTNIGLTAGTEAGVETLTFTLKEHDGSSFVDVADVDPIERDFEVSVEDAITDITVEPVDDLYTNSTEEEVKYTVYADTTEVNMNPGDLTWYSTDTSVVDFSGTTGYINVVGAGTATVRVESSNGTVGEVDVTVLDEELVASSVGFTDDVPTTVTVNGSDIDVSAGTVVYDQNGNDITETATSNSGTVSYNSLNTNIATVGESTGLVTPGSEAGTVTIRATLTLNGNYVDSSDLEVTVEAAKKSIYAFEFEEELTPVANEDITTDMTFKAIENLGEGYDDVRFNFGVEGPEGETVTFTAADSTGDEIQTVETGYYTGVWGPEGGITVERDYDATTKWTLNFSKAGEYTIIFSLVYVGGEIDPGITGSVTVTVTEAE
jgi:hypothetical protein